jgi:hypothetical protein
LHDNPFHSGSVHRQILIATEESVNGFFGVGALLVFLLLCVPTVVYLWSADPDRRSRALQLLRLFLRRRWDDGPRDGGVSG